MSDDTHLKLLEAQSVYILREAFQGLKNLAMLWSFGKDSTVMLHLVRKAFFGRVPFPVVHCDTALEMDEVYAFRDHYTQQWGLTLLTHACPPLEAMDPRLPPDARVAARKTAGLKEVLSEHRFDGLLVGIRRDEEGTRAKERVFSPRGTDAVWDLARQPMELWAQYITRVPYAGHMRIHPLLHWTEIDIWHYIAQEKIPVVPLYFARAYAWFEGRNFNGQLMRFRSIGERGITWPVPSMARTVEDVLEELRTTRTAERAGRPMGMDEDDSSFERLRVDGYM